MYGFSFLQYKWEKIRYCNISNAIQVSVNFLFQSVLSIYDSLQLLHPVLFGLYQKRGKARGVPIT